MSFEQENEDRDVVSNYLLIRTSTNSPVEGVFEV